MTEKTTREQTSAKPTSSRDRVGYLRWTPTSCRRCGYEKTECACIGGFAEPMAAPTQTPREQTSRLTQVNPLIDFADRWSVDGDYIRCRRCKRPQQVAWMHHDFPHATNCPHAEDAERNPWKTLGGLITAQSAKAKQP